MGKKLATGCLIMFITPFIVIGIGTFSYSVYQFLEGFSTHYWQETPATITDCQLKSYENSESVTEKVFVSYTYKIDGKNYTSSQIAAGYSTDNVEDHRKLYQILNNAKKIMVYVNPRNHKKSVVIKGTNNSMVFLFLFSIMWNSFLAVFVIPYFLWRKEEVNQLMLNDSRSD
jgi:hypothetical protein